jgi:hypothetical protein
MDASSTMELYLLERSRVPMWLAPDPAGTPTVLRPQPFLLRTVYVRQSLDDMAMAVNQLATRWAWLLLPISCPDGPPIHPDLFAQTDFHLFCLH